MPFGEKENHESYGLLSIGRMSSNMKINLFGSSIKHMDTIRLTISRAEKERELNQDFYFPREKLIEIEMSPTQFAEAITTLNHGSGVPITIRMVEGKIMENCPEEDKRKQFEDEFDGEIKKLCYNIKKLTERTKEILNDKKPPNKAEKKEMLNEIFKLEQTINTTIPFISGQFNEQMDRTVLEAKGEVEAFVTNKVNQLGLQELRKQIKMLE